MPRVSHQVAARTGFLALLGVVVVYLIGTYHRFVWDIEETCRLGRGQSFDPVTISGDALFPISQRCNADYDLVPAFVNPTIVALTVLAIAATIVTWRTRPIPAASETSATKDGAP